MKKYGLFLLMVLVLSTSVWAGYTSLSLKIQTSNNTATGTLSFIGPKDARICVDPIDRPGDKSFSVKIFVDCADCSCKGTKYFTTPINFPSNLCSGKYTVSVEVYCRCHKCCQSGGPKRMAKLTSSFTISGKGSSNSSSSSSSFWSSFTQSSSLF